MRGTNHASSVTKLIATATIACLAVAACSPSNDTSGDTGQGDPGATNDFVMVVAQVPENLDYDHYEGEPHLYAGYPIGSRLVTYDASELEGGGCTVLANVSNITGDLAESWEVSEDGKEIVFHLREGVQSPFGNELTAEDVKWSFDRYLELGWPANFLLYNMVFYAEDPFEAVDEHTFKVHVAESTPLDVVMMTFYAMTVFDSKEVQSHATSEDPWAHEWLSRNTADFGPWSVTQDEFQPGSEIIYRANPNYYGERGNIDRFVLREVPESSTRMQLVASGGADHATQLTFQQYQQLSSTDGVNVHECVSASRDLLALQLDDPRFGDVRVREAISLAIDRDSLIDAAYAGYGVPARFGLSSTYDFEQEGVGYEHDLDKARQLMSEAGYEDGFEATLVYNPARPGPHAEELALYLQSQLRELGITVTLRLVNSSAEMSDLYINGDYEMALYQEPPAIADPYYSLNLYNASWSAQNGQNYQSAEYDELVRAIGTTPVGDERQEMIGTAASVITTDYPLIYLVDRVAPQAFGSTVDGFNWAGHGYLRPHYLSKGKAR